MEQDDWWLAASIALTIFFIGAGFTYFYFIAG
jgi:hypothetical protein